MPDSKSPRPPLSAWAAAVDPTPRQFDPDLASRQMGLSGDNDALALCREGVRMAFAAAASRRAPAAPRSDAPR